MIISTATEKAFVKLKCSFAVKRSIKGGIEGKFLYLIIRSELCNRIKLQ